MSDSQMGEPGQPAVTAGSLLREARMAKGLHVAALAASMKVAPRKLELLESDKLDELPGASFTRALAQTVCRSLKIDSAPVLALLPQQEDPGLAQMSHGLNTPFRDRPGRHVPGDMSFFSGPFMLGAALLVLASAVLYILPAGWIAELTQRAVGRTEPVTSSPTTESVIVVPAEPDAPASSAMDGAPATPPVSTADAARIEAAVAPAVVAPSEVSGALVLRASAESWVEVIDSRGSTLISRMLQAGESVGLDGASPLRVRIGNAAATEVSYKGQPVQLVATRDNVAKLELR